MATRAGRSPNFLLITTDQQRWDAMGLHNPILQTPVMDAIARQGMQFGRMYPTNAICMSARSSMITGRSQRGQGTAKRAIGLGKSGRRPGGTGDQACHWPTRAKARA